MMQVMLPLLPLLPLLAAGSSATEHHEFCIIGAGPGGLQLGHLMHHAGNDYVILERADRAGSFFTKYPRHDKLISINKRWTDSLNTEYSLRHDWNSLLSNDSSLQFRHYSNQMFPHREVMVRYLGDYADKLQLNVRYSTNVNSISKNAAGQFVIASSANRQFTCDVAICATGLWQLRNLSFQGHENTVGYDTMSLNRTQYENKRVLIIGKGNAAFETAAHLYGASQLIHLISRNRVRLAWSTHYVGDVRAVNNELLDTYQLKSIDALLEGDANEIKLVRDPTDGAIVLSTTEPGESELFGNLTNSSVEFSVTEENRFKYDVIIRANGFKFDASWLDGVNQSTVVDGKYPKMLGNFESADVPNLFFAGTLTHGLDYRKAAGGFIHGFRYTARALHRILSATRHRTPWPASERPISELVDALVQRVNEGSGTYQMFSNLGDVVLINRQRESFKLLEEFPVSLLPQLEQNCGHKVEQEQQEIIVFVFEYGKNFSGPAADVFHEMRASCEPGDAWQCNFLHPVFYHYDRLPTAGDPSSSLSPSNLPKPKALLHLIEDVSTNFRSSDQHVMQLTAFLENIVKKPLAPISLENCILQSMLGASDYGHQFCNNWHSWSRTEL